MTLERPLTGASTRHRANLYVGLDVEGILTLPKADFAWLTYDRKLSPVMRALFPRERCEAYDGKYDDGRYFAELEKPEGHSTGTWPCLSLALAGADGITDRDLITYAEKTTQETPGTGKFLKDAMEKTGGNVYLVTSSYPAVALKIAYKYGIPSSHVVTMGRQLSGDSLESYDRKRADLDKKKLDIEVQVPTDDREQRLTVTRAVRNQRKLLYDIEVMERSPLNVFNQHAAALGIFMEKYVDITEKLGGFYGKSAMDSHETGMYEDCLQAHDELFSAIPKELRELENFFLSPKSRGNMGSRNKTRALKDFHPNCDDWVYVGNGIEDGHPIGFARYGISMNACDRHALQQSKAGIATTDVSNLIPVLDQALEGELDVEGLKMQLDSAGAQAFSPHDIRRNMEMVVAAANDAEKTLNELWVPV